MKYIFIIWFSTVSFIGCSQNTVCTYTPIDITFSNILNTSVRINWTIPINTCQPDIFRVQVRKAGDSEWITNHLPSTETLWNVYSLVPSFTGTAYETRIVATYNGSEVSSNILTFLTLPLD
jgi:hypothetical protein